MFSDSVRWAVVPTRKQTADSRITGMKDVLGTIRRRCSLVRSQVHDAVWKRSGGVQARAADQASVPCAGSLELRVDVPTRRAGGSPSSARAGATCARTQGLLGDGTRTNARFVRSESVGSQSGNPKPNKLAPSSPSVRTAVREQRSKTKASSQHRTESAQSFPQGRPDLRPSDHKKIRYT